MEDEINAKLEQITVEKKNFIVCKQGTIEAEYSIGDIVGSGAFATVRKVIHKKTKQPRALKILKKKKGQDANKMYLEVDILKTLVHPNILSIFEFYEDSKNFYLVTEQCEGGELFDQIVSKGSLTEKEAAEIMHQLVIAINYAHLNNVVHRDLKPENILLDTKNGSVIKIIDWGNARFFDKTKKMTKASGTPYYIAPEVLTGKYNEKCDIWSLGVVMYILICGYPPFNGDTDDEILEKVLEGTFVFPEEEWGQISDLAKSVISDCFTKNYKKRKSAEELLKHPWFEKTLKLKENAADIPVKSLMNMKKFRADRKLQQAALTYMVNHLLSKEEKNEMIDLFKKFDKDNNGQLSKDEIFEGFKSILGEIEAKTEVERIMKDLDMDKSGYIDYNEFVIAASNRSKLFNKEKLELCFNEFDSDGNGFITRDEIKTMFNGIAETNDGTKVLDSIINQVDENNDGKISLEEFKKMIMNIMD